MPNSTVTILKMIHGGYGLAEQNDGPMIMVRHSLPGEQVRVKIDKTRKDYCTGRVQSVIDASPWRIVPPCSYYGRCGGCDLQHGSYLGQLEIKRDIVRELLERQRGLEGYRGKWNILPTLACTEELAYRQRLRFKVDDDGRFGMVRHQSHDLVEIDRCLIARPEINHVLAQFHKEPADLRPLLELSEELQLLVSPDTQTVTALFHLRRKPRPADFTRSKRLLAAIDGIDRIFITGKGFPITQAAPDEPNRLLQVSYHDIPGIKRFSLAWEVGGFCQVNLDQNRNLIAKTLDFLAVQPHETVLDLFCGMGNFSIPLAVRAQSLLGVEGQGSAVRSARHNSSLAGLENTEFRKRPIEQICKELRAKSQTFDCLVIDPPRQGVPGLAGDLSALCRKRLVYISCDPATLCRDLADLHREGFEITRVQPVDMFPQTHHVETLVLLEKH